MELENYNLIGFRKSVDQTALKNVRAWNFLDFLLENFYTVRLFTITELETVFRENPELMTSTVNSIDRVTIGKYLDLMVANGYLFVYKTAEYRNLRVYSFESDVQMEELEAKYTELRNEIILERKWIHFCKLIDIVWGGLVSVPHLYINESDLIDQFQNSNMAIEEHSITPRSLFFDYSIPVKTKQGSKLVYAYFVESLEGIICKKAPPTKPKRVHSQIYSDYIQKYHSITCVPVKHSGSRLFKFSKAQI